MTKTINRFSFTFVALAAFVAISPLSAIAATYAITAPNSVTVTESPLITSSNGTASNSADVTAAKNSENTIELSLQGTPSDVDDTGLAHVRFSPTIVSGDTGTVQLWVYESGSDTWYDTTITGWGPMEGFPVEADYQGDLEVVVIADVPGTYVLKYEMVDVDTSSVVTSGESTLTVAERTSASVDTEQELNDALADAAITTITIDGDFTIGSTITVNRAVTIDGNDRTISVSDSITGTALLITGSNVVVTDLTIDSAGKSAKGSTGIQGIQAYVAENVALRNVTSMNAGKSGIMVNGSTVTVENVTTSGNTWHGINVDQGSGVTTPSILTIAGTSSHLETGPAIYIDDTASGSVSGSLSQYTEVASAPAVAYFLSTVDSEEELRAALANSAISTISLSGDITSTSVFNVSRSVTINGNGNTVLGDFVKTSSSNNSVFLITASNVAMSDLVVDGETSTNNLHGINIYVATGITLSDIETKNVNTGINVNGSTVTVSNVTTSNSAWHGMNVDQGSGVTAPASLTVSGTSNHSEAADIPHIWVDDNTLTGVTVTDSNSQYETAIVTWDDAGTPRTGTRYTLREVQSGGGGGRGSRNNSDDEADTETVDTTDDSAGEVDSGAGEVLGAATYNFTSSLTIGASGQDVTELQTILIAGGYLKIDAPTGYFGPLTAAAVKLYQAANGIPATGFVGPLTLAALNAGEAPAVATDSAKIASMIAQLQQILELLKGLK